MCWVVVGNVRAVREATPRSPEANETQPESQRRAARQPTRRSPKTNGTDVAETAVFAEDHRKTSHRPSFAPN